MEVEKNQTKTLPLVRVLSSLTEFFPKKKKINIKFKLEPFNDMSALAALT